MNTSNKSLTKLPKKEESVPIDSTNSSANLHLFREIDRLEGQILELKNYTSRISDNLFDDVEKIETMLFNSTGGGLMSRVEKMTFSLEELNKESEEFAIAIKQLQDFRYTISSLVASLKDKQDDSLSQKSKARNLAEMIFIAVFTTLLTFALSNFPGSSQHSKPANVKQGLGLNSHLVFSA